MVVPLREELRDTDLRLGRVLSAQPERNRLQVELLEGRRTEIAYDQLIVALGSVSRTLPIPGLLEHAIGFKTLSEAIALRNRVLSCLEIAETLEDPEERAQYLRVVLINKQTGAGTSRITIAPTVKQAVPARAIRMTVDGGLLRNGVVRVGGSRCDNNGTCGTPAQEIVPATNGNYVVNLGYAQALAVTIP